MIPMSDFMVSFLFTENREELPTHRTAGDIVLKHSVWIGIWLLEIPVQTGSNMRPVLSVPGPCCEQQDIRQQQACTLPTHTELETETGSNSKEDQMLMKGCKICLTQPVNIVRGQKTESRMLPG